MRSFFLFMAALLLLVGCDSHFFVKKSLNPLLPQGFPLTESSLFSDNSKSQNPGVPPFVSLDWKWEKTISNNDTIVFPARPDQFFLRINPDYSVALKTDCNTGFSNIQIQPSEISFSPIGSTRKYCEGSQETHFFQMIQEVRHLFMPDPDHLIFELPYDSGSIQFSRDI